MDSKASANPLLLQQAGTKGSASESQRAEAVADRAWLKLKQFSLLRIYSEMHGERTASLHRLLAQSLRSRMPLEQATRMLSCAAWAVERHWFFDAADTSSWSAASVGIEHVQAIGRHTQALLRTAAKCGEGADPALMAALQLRVSALLTRGALCMSMALSRFEQARQALATARLIQDQPLSTSASTTELQRGRALTLETAGKVARYCGQLSEAEALLREALQLWRDCADENGTASTLHELGVVHLRRADWAAATELLTQSLEMKRGRRNDVEGVGEERVASTRFSEEAATLHQLAVAAMSSKPPRLDEASALLREALTVEAKGPFALVGRAATLQQLARVAERRGDRKGARAMLQDALELHREAYGEAVPHVNKAAVLSQLASLSLQSGDAELAAGYLTEALGMRRQIYGRGSAHMEMALNLGKLGECDRARGDHSGAATNFAAQRTMLETLALSEASAAEAATSGQPLQRVIRAVAVGGDAMPPMRILNHLQGAIRWQRTIAREAGDAARATELAAEAQQLQHALMQSEAGGESEGAAESSKLVRCIGNQTFA